MTTNTDTATDIPVSAPHAADAPERRRHYTTYNVAVILFMSIGSLSYGYSASIISTTLGQPSFITYMKLDTASNASALEGAITSLYFVGGVFGTFLGSYVADRWGRVRAIGLGAVLMVISGGLLAGSTAVAMFITFRFFSGMAGYILIAGVPLWIIEIVPPGSRGMLVDIHPAMFVFGYLVACWTGVGFYYAHGSGGIQWRIPIAVQCAFPLILLCGLKWMPESPRFLISKDRTDEAWPVLKRLHNRPDDPDDHYAKAEFYQIKKQLELDRQLESSYLSLITNKSYRKRLVYGSLWIFFIESSGVLVIVTYASTFYGLLGYGPAKQLSFTAGWMTISWASCVGACFTVDLFPRQITAGFGLLGCLVCLVVESVLIALFVDQAVPNEGALAAAVAMMFLFPVFFSFGLDGPTFIFLGEIYPNHLRSMGLNIGLAVHALTNVIWLAPCAAGLKAIGWKYFLPLICVSFVGVVSIFWFYPDTRRLPLEEVAKIFGDDELVAVYQRDLESVEMTDPKAFETEHVEIVAKRTEGEGVA
ncbi:hypothetical protein A1O3_00274 [Capronia epimyces CBS 606.96]|uniref:Major facilitator superfamily (MFS) profile domain-containing protein n=1 Tax=Capronia epimyces CBS 606.96 TaxID=1182542 RepID=W9ZB15_9EURO|nr:uncharacterized protein A1O3_00274 [Capronia epimyces CBS 606.96]EXJ91724.1 hypothetical protein A1O3_00274 [Capronia epimyces CBS 606.96]